ncbi:hypothetical protein K439DRAFT_1370067 [Ramaria rubella]|nr:hypothetical protein K439DRAFT_1370067 [Ramaria rubella]
MRLNKSSFNPLPPPFHDIGLGWRPIGYRPTAVDYAAYEVICGEFFRQHRARAALMHGGIVWCLAVEHICPESVLIGPTDEVFRIYHCETGELYFVFLYYIHLMGIFQVKPNLSKDLLWWPKPSSWSHSGLNVGYWSPAAGVWYQNWLAHIQDNTAELYHAKKWKAAVAMHRKTFKVADFNSNFSVSFLAGVQFP